MFIDALIETPDVNGCAHNINVSATPDKENPNNRVVLKIGRAHV